ncbi:hypothetical protein M2404_003845 [Rheinheimera pacifica]|uniref:hypothetical protein n=1 Tax=Rheinheimera pacifica TaxID=173990 RepID=UPI00216A38EA|nr:hypothetical protein [Rheinheimera pacifica]MCS4309473.1 hypothetical protein [Rheinheimera pacifica]
MKFVPGKSDAYNKGWEAFFCSRELGDNPYNPGSEDHKDWAAGFVAGSGQSGSETILLDKIIGEYFGGDKTAAAAAVSDGGVSMFQVNNWISQKREFIQLANGDFILSSKKQKIIKVPKKSGALG